MPPMSSLGRKSAPSNSGAIVDPLTIQAVRPPPPPPPAAISSPVSMPASLPALIPTPVPTPLPTPVSSPVAPAVVAVAVAAVPQQLRAAIVNRLVDDISFLLSDGASVAQTLHVLCDRAGDDSERDTEMFDVLLKAGAQVNERNARKETPLFLAARNGRTALVQRLLALPAESKLDVNAADEAGYTPFTIAVAYECLRVVELLMDEPRVRVNAPNVVGRAALNLLSWRTPLRPFKRPAELIKLLARCKRLEPNFIEPVTLRTPLFECMFDHFNTQPVLQSLIVEYGARLKTVSEDGTETALHFALFNGYFDTAKLLIERKCADMSARNSLGQHPLHVLAKQSLHGDEKAFHAILDAVLKAGANVHDGGTTGLHRTPFLLAIEAGNIRCLKPLFDFDPTVAGDVDAGGDRAIHLAVWKGSASAVRCLVSHSQSLDADAKSKPDSKADEKQPSRNVAGVKFDIHINGFQKGGLTPLQLLCFQNPLPHEEAPAIAKLLIEHGADLSIPAGPSTDDFRRTSLIMLARKDALEQRCESLINSLITTSITRSHSAALTALNQQYALASGQKWSTLAVAVRCGHCVLARKLLDAGVSTADVVSNPALSLAQIVSSTEVKVFGDVFPDAQVREARRAALVRLLVSFRVDLSGVTFTGPALAAYSEADAGVGREGQAAAAAAPGGLVTEGEGAPPSAS